MQGAREAPVAAAVSGVVAGLASGTASALTQRPAALRGHVDGGCGGATAARLEQDATQLPPSREHLEMCFHNVARVCSVARVLKRRPDPAQGPSGNRQSFSPEQDSALPSPGRLMFVHASKTKPSVHQAPRGRGFRAGSVDPGCHCPGAALSSDADPAVPCSRSSSAAVQRSPGAGPAGRPSGRGRPAQRCPGFPAAQAAGHWRHTGEGPPAGCCSMLSVCGTLHGVVTARQSIGVSAAATDCVGD